jgi:hypothetical protein
VAWWSATGIDNVIDLRETTPPEDDSFGNTVGEVWGYNNDDDADNMELNASTSSFYYLRTDLIDALSA